MLFLSNEIIIYGLRDPATKALRYVGKTKDLPTRIRSHRQESRGNRLHNRKVNWLRSLPSEPVVEILERCDSETWAETERQWIAIFRMQGVDLTNYADGGQTSPVEGKGHTEEAKVKMREAQLARGTKPPSRKGQLVSEQARQNLSRAAIRSGRRPPPSGGWNKGIKRSHCPSGHPYSNENTRIVARRGYEYQSCKECERLAQHRHYQKRRQIP